MSKVGLLFGSFNPVHVGHLIIADQVLVRRNLDTIWFVLSPQNPFKNIDNLADEKIRWKMLLETLKNEVKFEANDIEFSLPTPSYTISTLLKLCDKYPNNEFELIMGSDNLQTFHLWKNYKEIYAQFPINVYQRPGYQMDLNVQLSDVNIYADVPQVHLSASIIRNICKSKGSLKYLVKPEVESIIHNSNLYQ